MQTLRLQGRNSDRQVISKGLLNSSQGGTPLEVKVPRLMATRFGAVFRRIQVQKKCRGTFPTLNGRAFAYGHHIYFNEGEYQPEN